MIPLVDDYLQSYLVQKLKFLKKHPKLVDAIFYTGRRETLDNLREFIVNKPVKVILGYPKDQTSLPCYVITLAPESEVPFGLGDGQNEFMDELGILDSIGDTVSEDIKEVAEDIEEALKLQVNGTYMNSTYRIECWSDNGDLTTYMYAILKWCLWSSRAEMLQQGFVNITLSGTDLEPVPDYMPVFIYRRSIQINLQYENHYFNDLMSTEEYIKVLDKIEDYGVDEDGNIVDGDGNIIIPQKWTWVLRPHYYTKSITVTEDTNL